MTGCTPEMIADPSLGACERNREGRIDLGIWRPFYQGYVCDMYLLADELDMLTHVNPGKAEGKPLFRQGDC